MESYYVVLNRSLQTDKNEVFKIHKTAEYVALNFNKSMIFQKTWQH